MSSEHSASARSEAQLFAAAAAAVARSDDLDDALAALLGLAAEFLGASAGGAYILDQDHDELELAVTLGLDAEIPGDAVTLGPVADSDVPLAAAVKGRRPIRVDAASPVPLFPTAAAAYLLPLVVRRDGIELALGELALGFRGPLPSAERLAVAEPIADLAAVAVERALALSLGSERAEWFERLAHTDPLTGLANRRTLDRMLELELARAARQGAALSVAVFDVDRFEDFEREAGHEAADAMLQRVAQVLAASVRLIDTVARYGGSQFVLVAPGPDGVVVAERLVRGVAALDPVAGLPVSLSAGIAAFPGDARTSEELVEIASGAAQRAREAGGGQVASGREES